MKKFKYIVLIALTCMSCNDNLLDLQTYDKVSEATVWQDPQSIELFVNARYNELPHGFYQWGGGLRLTSLTDESYHQTNSQLYMYTQGAVTASNGYYFSGFWSDAYKAIRNDNIFLKNISQVVGKAQIMNQLTAEIRFLRAFFYAELIARYGGVPLIKEPFELSDNFNVPRATYEECTQFIVDELNLAIPNLLNRNEANGANFGRITKGAAIALKARTLLYAASPLFNQSNDQAKWQAVSDACKELFDLNQYSLSADYKGLFLNANNSEVIFFKQFIGKYGAETNSDGGYFHCSGGQSIDVWRSPNSFGGWIDENPLQNFVDQYETLKGKIPVLGYTGSADNLQPVLNPEATDYNPSRPYANRDPRLDYSVNHDESIFKGREIEFWYGGRDSRDPNIDGWRNGSVLGYGIRKSLDEGWSYEFNNQSSSQPWIYIRLSEVYLTYAEAEYHLGNRGVAVDYVNRIRSRASVNMPPISSGGDLLEKIKHERKIELAFEGNRWYDARRWKDAASNFAKRVIGVEIKKASDGTKSYRYFVQQLRNFPESHYFWPIPIEEILKSNLIQNPGY